jgi:hypothetical protein
VLGRHVGVRGSDGFELDPAAETLHVVEVDADVAPGQQPPALAHHDDRAQRVVERRAQELGIRHVDQVVGADAGGGFVRPRVGDQLRAPALLLAELQASLAGVEVGVGLDQRSVILGAMAERRRERPLGIAVAGLQLDVAAGVIGAAT